jgi:KaiC/GvpD/RAD55 family RecA-like ATPase
MFPDNFSILVIGDQGTGMFEFCCYLGASYLRAGERVVFVNTSTPPDSVRRQMTEFGINAFDFELEDKLVMIDCYTRGQVHMTDITIRVRDINNLEEVIQRVTEGIVKLGGAPVKVIFHSITPLHVEHEDEVMQEFMEALSSMVKISGSMTCSVHRGALSDEQIAGLAASADGVLEMMVDESFKRFVRIRKLKGARISQKWVPFEFEREEAVDGTALIWKGSR